MSVLSDDDIRRLADAITPRLVSQVKASHHEFWIGPEQHYKEHIELGRLVQAFDADTVAGLKELGRIHANAKRNAFKLILWLLLLVSALSAVVYGVFVHKPAG